MKKLIIFTDLDGTLLDFSTYSFKEALPALHMITEKNIPLIICSSKTRAEIEYYRKKLENTHPFVSENGGGIFIPLDYFRPALAYLGFSIEKTRYYLLIRLGADYNDLRKTIKELQSEGHAIKGFGDMTVEEVTDVTGLTVDEAEMAKQRNFDEPFIFDGNETEIQRLFDAIKEKGFNHTQGRFFHILGNSDKGKAVSILIELYRKQFGPITTIAIGDNPNDTPMLKLVDYPIIVQKPDGTYDHRIDIPNLVKAGDFGPRGWNKAVLTLLSQIS